jgi:hypothetical protein
MLPPQMPRNNILILPTNAVSMTGALANVGEYSLAFSLP